MSSGGKKQNPATRFFTCSSKIRVETEISDEVMPQPSERELGDRSRTDQMPNDICYMKATFLAIGLLAIFAAAFAEEVKEDKKELTETGIAVLEKIHELKKEQEDALAAIDDEEEKDLISSTLDKDEDEADDKLEVPEEGSTRVKRAARRRPHRGAAARRRHQKRAVARRRHQKRAVARKRHQKRAAAIKRRRHQKRAAAARRVSESVPTTGSPTLTDVREGTD
ncbi:unnamed protein product [Heligmosomoides polygyrus]|uniref:Protamine-2 n=1 Tax=Heligmosomoides polygyrus TaxID=6339 RepID=A0A183GQN1_HELPZ|nr:unnamed protein product [Heligmosomoides polygyrus]